jgi:hypothetical protein
MAKNIMGHVFIFILASCSVLYIFITAYTELLIRSGETPLSKAFERAGYTAKIEQINRYNFLFGRHLYGLFTAVSETTEVAVNLVSPKFSKSNSINFSRVQFLSNPETWILDNVRVNSQEKLHVFLRHFLDIFVGVDNFSSKQPVDLLLRAFSFGTSEGTVNVRLDADLVHLDANRILLIKAKARKGSETYMTFGEISIIYSLPDHKLKQDITSNEQKFQMNALSRELSRFLPANQCELPSVNNPSSISVGKHIAKVRCYSN